MNANGQVNYYRSNVDGRFYPYGICASGTHAKPRPLLVGVSPGASPAGAAGWCKETMDIALKYADACIAMMPIGHGPGSVYQNYGEEDLFEAIEHACSLFAVDRDRITIHGGSMGGAATWYNISHHPDFFAGAVTYCGYCDYRLWEKPGGSTFYMRDWEEPSWMARSAALLVENLKYTPVSMFHGEWDRAVGGGVPKEHSIQMAKRLKRLGYPYKYTEVPKVGHACVTPKVRTDAIKWLVKQRKARNPAHVPFSTFELRHNRSYWVTIRQFRSYGKKASVDATRKGRRFNVDTANVQVLMLSPEKGPKDGEIHIDGQILKAVNLAKPVTLCRSAKGQWRKAGFRTNTQKRHPVSGPIGDLFHAQTILVPGTIGSEEETFFNEWVAKDQTGRFKIRNGGVHRGGILGETSFELQVVNDKDLTAEQLKSNNLILHGNAKTNSVLKRYLSRLPLSFAKNAITLGGKKFSGKGIAAFAVFPHPENPERYVAVHAGLEPDAITWGSHLDYLLLPDYLVYAHGDVVEWGFFDNDWRIVG